MPSLRTTVIAVRAPDAIAASIRREAARRNMTVNELLNLELAAKFRPEREETHCAQHPDSHDYPAGQVSTPSP